MINNYIQQGRDAALKDIAQWIKKNAPPSYKNGPAVEFLSKSEKRKYLDGKIDAFKQRARINVIWRQSLTDRLQIDDDEVVLATNTIIELIEKELSIANTVRLTNFGDFKPISQQNGTKRILFVPSPQWKKELNEPLYQSDIGLKRKLYNNKLIRRNI